MFIDIIDFRLIVNGQISLVLVVVEASKELGITGDKSHQSSNHGHLAAK